MAKDTVTIRLNQQQWELVDKTVERGIAASREELLLKALRDYGAGQAGGAGKTKPKR